MKKINIAFWICTVLVFGPVGFGSIFETISAADSVKIFTALGYPAYLVPFLGFAKILAIVVIVIPGYPRLKEWAYAGFAFDVLGALYSNIALGRSFPELIFIILPIVFLAASYVLYHKKLELRAKQPVDANSILAY